MHPSMATRKIIQRRVNNNSNIPSSGTPTETSKQGTGRPHIITEECFVAQESCKLFVSSWNVGGLPPPDNLDLEELFDTQSIMADIYVFGFQEVVPLNAGNIFVQENNHISVKWNSLIKAALNQTITRDNKLQKTGSGEMQKVHPVKSHGSTDFSIPEYECIISKQMVGLYLTVWVRRKLQGSISDPVVSCVGCGILGRLGNKGSVSISFSLHGASFCFVCSHLASGGKQGDERQRNTDVTNILARTLFSAGSPQHQPRKILNHDWVIWLGDLNYRIYLPEELTRSLVKNKMWSILLENDQLKAELTEGRIFEGWNEEEIKFAPTYKYVLNSDDYYGTTIKKKAARTRMPAWCDRIIWFGKGLEQIQYNRVECRLSDHRPVRAIFRASIKESKTSPDSVWL